METGELKPEAQAKDAGILGQFEIFACASGFDFQQINNPSLALQVSIVSPSLEEIDQTKPS